MKKFFNIKIIVAILIIVFSFSLWQINKNHAHELALCNKHKVVYPPHPNSIALEKVDMLDSIPAKNIQMGIEEMAKHKLVIVGITRDNATAFPTMIRNLEHIGSFFKDYKVLIVENDSTDGTKTALRNWKINNQKVNFISKTFNNKKRPSHRFLANIRNYYIDEVEDNKEYDDFDMVMMIDMDMDDGIDIRGIEDSFSKINQWDAVCSNGVSSTNENKMYDIFAFRSESFPWSPKEWHQICFQNDLNNEWTQTCTNGEKYSRGFFRDLMAKWNGKNTDKLFWTLIAPQEKIKYDADTNLIPVHSCFGGMAFYKRSFITGCRYDSLYNDCEHIAFHQCLREKNNGRMVMNPAQMIKYD